MNTVLFLFSLAGLGTIISAKALNEKKGIKVLPEGICLGCNERIILWWNYFYKHIKSFSFKKFFKFIKRTLRIIRKIFLSIVWKLIDRIGEKDTKVVKFVKGEKILKRNGEVSKFLQDVTEHKKSLKQDIEEDV